MPEADNLGVSRKIEDPKERDRLKKIGDKLARRCAFWPTRPGTPYF